MLRKLGLTIIAVSLAGLALGEVLPVEPQAPQAPKRVAVIPIEGEINGITARAVTQRLERAQREGVNIVVIRLDTPGGLLMPALEKIFQS